MTEKCVAVHKTKLREWVIIDSKGNSKVERPLGNNGEMLQGYCATVTREKCGGST